MRLTFFLALAVAPCAFSQSQVLRQGAHSMEITIQRLDGELWKTVAPNLVFSKDDRIRLQFRTNFDGYVYVTDQSTSGKYEQLFPREETGQNNRVIKNHDYTVPTTETVFRIGGPPGHDVIYWLMSPVALDGTQKYQPLSDPPVSDAVPPSGMTPRCDGEIFRVRGDCVDSSAGPQELKEDDKLPPHLSGSSRPRDLLFLRKESSTVIASANPLSGPVVYQFRLAHK